MKVLGVIVNIFFPGIGTMIVGKIGTGIVQLILSVIAWVLMFTVVGFVIGAPLAFIIWVWAIVSAATSEPEPVRVEVVHRDAREPDELPRP